eukprot:15469313-Alexandrium_andersonii.AAC.2
MPHGPRSAEDGAQSDSASPTRLQPRSGHTSCQSEMYRRAQWRLRSLRAQSASPMQPTPRASSLHAAREQLPSNARRPAAQIPYPLPEMSISSPRVPGK